MSNSRVYDLLKIEPKEEPEDPEIADFSIEELSKSIGDMVELVSKQERVPFSLTASFALGAVSAVLGKGVEIQSGGSRTSKPNLFIIASAESGSGKSVTFNRFFKPIVEFESAQKTQFVQVNLPKLISEHQVLEEEIKKLKRKLSINPTLEQAFDRQAILDQIAEKTRRMQELERSMKGKVIYISDSTIEKIEMLLHDNDGTLALISSDARKVVKNINGRHSKDNSVDDSVFLIGWSGDTDKIDRVGRESIILQEPCLSMVLAIQPDKLEEMYSKPELHEGGFLARCLVCHTNAKPQRII